METKTIKELLEEVEKRFGKDWETAEIETEGYPFLSGSIRKTTAVICDSDIWNRNGLIYKLGVWAEPKKPFKIGDFGLFWDDGGGISFGVLVGFGRVSSYPYKKELDGLFYQYDNFQPITNKNHIEIIKSYLK